MQIANWYFGKQLGQLKFGALHVMPLDESKPVTIESIVLDQWGFVFNKREDGFGFSIGWVSRNNHYRAFVVKWR